MLLVAGMLGSAAAGEYLRPSLRLAEVKPKIELESQIPKSFADWQVDPHVRPVVPDPSVQAMLDDLYSQTLARTYVNRSGDRIMLSIAYGSDQSNEATAVHRPEFCYSAQGFRVKSLGEDRLKVGNTMVPVAKVLAHLGRRNEPIIYWVTLDEEATLPGLGRKINQLRYGLRGEIPDGMLVRVSSISDKNEEAFGLQQRFLESLFGAVPKDVRSRYFGNDISG
jgi:EpsI family protein